MIKNLSLEFIQLRNIQTITCEVYLNCDYLRKHLSQLDKNIAVYNNLFKKSNTILLFLGLYCTILI